MQLTINTDTEAPSNLRAIAAFLVAMADATAAAVKPVRAEITGKFAEPAEKSVNLMFRKNEPVVPFSPRFAAALAVPPVQAEPDVNDQDSDHGGAAALSAVPLPPPVPSTVDVTPFETAPEVPTAGIPMPPGAELPPVPTVPPAPAQNVAPPPVGVALDKSGLPHDSRIHSASPTITADGMWRKRRGLNDPALVARVEGDLRQTMGAPAPAAQSAIPFPPAPAAVPLPPASAGSASSAGTAQSPIDFVSLIQRITHETEVTKMLTMDEAEGAAKAAGLPGLAFLAARPDLVPDVSSRIDAILAS